jgi:hypothetical protein
MQQLFRVASALALFMAVQQILLGLQAPSPDSQSFLLRESKMSASGAAFRKKNNAEPSPTTHYSNERSQRILLFVTTIFSDRHVDFLSCCWPRLMGASDFLNEVDVIVFSNNETEISSSTINLTRQLFQNNPKFQFQFAPDDELQEIRQVTQKSIRFQMGANLGVKMAFSNGWFANYDWVIRINPDVLIRNSTWLAKDAMTDHSVDGIFAKCSEKPQRIHTDFFAFRPSALRADAFSHMVVQPHTTNLYNHEYTAYKEFSRILEEGKARFLPNIAPSNGFCRLRGEDAPIYHGHESCRKYDKHHQEQPYICNALEGWPIS